MCGIYGVVGETTIEEVLNNLKKLEYRGYDSSGIAYQDKGKIIIHKKVGEINNLINNIKETSKPISCAIAHTRWATHGKVNEENAHPQFSNNKNYVLVHNGIIENFKSLSETKLKNVNLKSQTDSEVIAALLNQQTYNNTLNNFQKVCSLLVGSYAIAMLHKGEQNKIYLAKNNSPLYVVKSKNKIEICSDFIASSEKNANVYSLDNGEFAVIFNNNIEFYDSNLHVIDKSKLIMKQELKCEVTNSDEHFMLKEINEIPTAIIKTVREYSNIKSFQKIINKKEVLKLKHIVMVACGTAYHACLMGKMIIEKQTDIHVNVCVASEFRYGSYKLSKNTLAIFVSQSGETADTLTCVKLLKEKGIKTLSITNVENSSISFLSDVCLYTKAGREFAVASTKAYITQVCMFYLLSGYFKNVVCEDAYCNQFNKTVQNILDCSKVMFKTNFNTEIKVLAEKYKTIGRIFIIGRQQDYKTSLEAALKIKEITYMHCEAYPAGELKHGTISQVDENTLVVAIITNSEISSKTLNAVHETKSRGAKILIISNDETLKKEADDFVLLPSFNECYMPIISIVPMQLLAYEMSVRLGYNPDKPRNLAKSVTVE